MHPTLILVLPELGGIGKSTIAEQLAAMLECARMPVAAMDGDPVSRGLKSRRRGRETLLVRWPATEVSHATAIRNVVLEKGIGVLDFGAGSSLTFSVEPTLAELCDKRKSAGLRTIIAAIGEASKPGNAKAITRLRESFPTTEMIFFRNQKSGNDWSSFTESVDGLPTVDVPAMPTQLTSWLSNYDLRKDESGEMARPALADLALRDDGHYKILSGYLRWLINQLSQQAPLRQLFGLDPLPFESRPPVGLSLPSGDLTDDRLETHRQACRAYHRLVYANAPAVGNRERWMGEMGEAALDYVKVRDALWALGRPGRG